MKSRQDITVREFCETKTEPHQLVVIRKGGWITATAWIDNEDLFRLPADIAHTQINEWSHGFIRIKDAYDGENNVPCIYLDLS